MTKLNAIQIEVLAMLLERPRRSTRATHHGYVSGACVSGLVRRGLASRRGDDDGDLYSITSAGQTALEGAKKNGNIPSIDVEDFVEAHRLPKLKWSQEK